MKSLLFTLVMLVVFTGALFSQNTTVKLPTTDSTSRFIVTDNGNNVLSQLYGNGEFYVLGTQGGASLPVLGSGPRMTWDPSNAAFRAGVAVSGQWDPTNIGEYSFAAGYNAKASGTYSAAMGSNTAASADNSTAMGANTTASGIYSTAMGNNTTASGKWSTAMGENTTASGDSSTAIGNFVSTNGKGGACIIGDASTSTPTTSSAAEQMTMRFDGGYRLFSKADLSAGVSLANGATSWSTISDSTKKEHFAKANGEYFLQSISQLRLGSWNYKGQDVEHYRHYGPMAQEIFHYFGKDTYGTIGNDTSLASADMDGIEMVCLQALEKRTSELQRTTAKIAELEKTVSTQQAELASRDKDIEELKSDFTQLKKEIAAMMESKPSSTHASLTSVDVPK